MGRSFSWNSAWSCLLHLLDFGVGVFLESIDFHRQAIDFFLRLRARRVVQYRAALLKLLLIRLERLRFFLQFCALLLRELLHFAARDLPLTGFGCDTLQIQERHSQRRLRLGGRGRGRGGRRLRKRRRGENHHAQHRGNTQSRHLKRSSLLES